MTNSINIQPKLYLENGSVMSVSNINAYLANGENVFVDESRKGISNLPALKFGSMANDGGNLNIFCGRL